MLIDGHPFDRVVRIRELLHSDIPGERELGEHELFGLLNRIPLADLVDAASDALYAAAKEAPYTSPAPGLLLPDTPWRCIGVGEWSRVWRRYGGHVLVVHATGTHPGWFYAVVDGVHLSGLYDAPWAYPTREQAQAVAEDAARGVPPRPVSGIRSSPGYREPFLPTMRPDR